MTWTVTVQPHGLFPGWWHGSWQDRDGAEVACTTHAYASSRNALLVAMTAYASPLADTAYCTAAD